MVVFVRLVVSSITLALLVSLLCLAQINAAPSELVIAIHADSPSLVTGNTAPNSPDLGNTKRHPAHLDDGLLVTATHPSHQATSVSPSGLITATFSGDVNASTITTATFAVQAMQSGLVTGDLAYDALARTMTMTPTRAFHTGEIIRPTATNGILSSGGIALTPYQWQFIVGTVDPITACGFVDIDAGLTSVRNSSVAWGDYDSDGRLDILLIGETSNGMPVSTVYHNEDSGAFSEIATDLTDVAWGSVAWGDYDNDGWLDILLTGQPYKSNPVSEIYHNNGDGTFTQIDADLTGVNFSSVAWGDYDNDGWLDIILTGYDPSNPVTELWRNQGDGTFTEIVTALPNVGEGSAAWGDYDNDGYLDLLLAGIKDVEVGERLAEVWRNQGGVSFTRAITFTGLSDSSVAWGDYDNDGWLDILLTGFSGNDATPVAQVLHNNGNGTFSDIGAGLSGVGYSAAAWGDYNNDGWLDILLTGSDNSATALAEIYRNNGAGGFDRFGGAALSGVWYGSVAWGDFDSNGRLGLLLTGQYAPYSEEAPLSRIYRSADDCHADLRITKRAEPEAAVPGATITYTLEYMNLGSLPATNVVISDSVPDGILNPSIVSSEGAVITQTGSSPDFFWQVEDLVAGLGGSIVLTGTLAVLDPGLVVTNMAEISSPQDVNLSNNHPVTGLTVLENPKTDLRLTKRGAPAAAQPGSVVTYTLTYTNAGSITATNVVISDSLPISISNPSTSSSGVGITLTQGTPNFLWQVGNLAPGRSGVITITGVLAVAPVGAVITNTAGITTPLESNGANNGQAVPLTVLAGPAPVTPAIRISRQIPNAVLSWADAPANFGGYTVWYSTKPHFLLGDSGVTPVNLPAGSTSYPHPDAFGTGKTYYYRVQGVNGNGVPSALSNQVGAFSFTLTPGK